MINNVDFYNLEAEKYWDFPKSYKGDKKTDVKNYIFSENYIGALKKDGHYFRYVKDDGESLQGRSKSVNGGYLNKIGHVPQFRNFFNSLPEGTVLLGELYFPNNSGSKNVTTIMGCLETKAIQRQAEKGNLSYYIFDIWAYDGKDMLNTKIEDRIKILNEKILPLAKEFKEVEVAKYYIGKNLWELLMEGLARGEEGIVMTRLGTTPDPGKRPARKTIKVKKELSNDLDVFFTGRYKNATMEYNGKEVENWNYWYNLKNDTKILGKGYEEFSKGEPIVPITKGYYYGWAGSIEIGAYDIKENKIVKIGYISGISDSIKEDIVNNNKDYVNKPCKVTAMEIDDASGALRHPKFIEFRTDISWQDCSTDKIYGE